LRKDTTLEKLKVLKEHCKPDKAYSVRKISQILGLSIPNTRRYLRKLSYMGLLDEYRKGRYKYYRVLFGERIVFGHRIKVLPEDEITVKEVSRPDE